MPLVYACITPHAGDLLDHPAKVQHTHQTLTAMGARLQALAPEVIVMVNPHGFRVQEALSICVAEHAVADWSPEIKLDFVMDPDLAHAIADEATTSNVPVVRYIYGASGGDACYIPLDWGAAVPLYFLGHRFSPQPKLVHCSPMRSLPLSTHYEFGRAIGRVLKESEQRIAFIASADQGHAHAENGPYGYDPASAQYDTWMQDVILKGNLDEILNADMGLVEAGKPDSLWPTTILAGVLNENPKQAQLLSYEVNDYFGILCAEYK